MIQTSYSMPMTFSAGGQNAASRGAGFIAGEENRLLKAVWQEWLARPEIYNPLVILGETGLGKSLIAELLIEAFRNEHRDSTTIALPGSDFARAYAEAVKADAVEQLRSRYCRANLLWVDNLEELRGKQEAQQELRKIIDELLGGGGLLIGVSRVPPQIDRGFAASLASRLMSGLVVPLQPPQTAARRAILEAASLRHEVQLTPDALDQLAESLSGSPNVLLHAVVQLALEAHGGEQPIDLQAVARYLEHEIEDRRPTLSKIAAAVARRFSIKVAELKGPSRRRALVQARGLAMLLARHLARESYQSIGMHFGDRDHSTVMHACRQTEALLLTDTNTRCAFEELSRKLNR